VYEVHAADLATHPVAPFHRHPVKNIPQSASEVAIVLSVQTLTAHGVVEVAPVEL
jgi:hypothetical protein